MAGDARGTLLLMVAVLHHVTGHGYLSDPPQRSSMWRKYPWMIRNHDDNGLNCGGVTTQYDKNGGRCGVCGDPYDGIQENMAPSGRYATGVIGRCYPAGTREINIQVELTSNHLGYMEFRICPHNNVKSPVTQACLDRNQLQVRLPNGGYSWRINVKREMKTINLLALLPPGMTCSQCILQWRYFAGNSWGCDSSPKGACGLGHGAQETFTNCADVAVLPSCDNAKNVPPVKTNSRWPPAGVSQPLPSIVRNHGAPEVGQRDIAPDVNNHFRLPNRREGYGNSRLRCEAVGIWADGTHDMAQWCNGVCPAFCPSNMCKCK